MYNNVTTCPVELLLWFHNLPWTHPMTATGGGSADGGATITLYEHIRRTHEKAVTDAAGLAAAWDGLEGRMDVERFKGVQVRGEGRRGEVRGDVSPCSACVHGVCMRERERERGPKACRYMCERSRQRRNQSGCIYNNLYSYSSIMYSHTCIVLTYFHMFHITDVRRVALLSRCTTLR